LNPSIAVLTRTDSLASRTASPQPGIDGAGIRVGVAFATARIITASYLVPNIATGLCKTLTDAREVASQPTNARADSDGTASNPANTGDEA